MKDEHAAAGLPWSHVASRGSFALHRNLIIGRREKILNRESVQIDLDITKASVSASRCSGHANTKKGRMMRPL
jgi:hypothetical protein